MCACRASAPELLIEIKKLLKTPFPVLYMSGHIDETAGADSISPDQIIWKPFEPKKLSQKSSSIISAQQAKPSGQG